MPPAEQHTRSTPPQMALGTHSVRAHSVRLLHGIGTPSRHSRTMSGNGLLRSTSSERGRNSLQAPHTDRLGEGRLGVCLNESFRLRANGHSAACGALYENAQSPPFVS